MISASILDIKEPKDIEISNLSKLDVDLIHVDVMDGVFVENKTMNFEEYKNILRLSYKPFDIHLMVSDVKKYIDDFSSLNPEVISFHYEVSSDVLNIINYIHSLGIKASLAINPSTQVSEIVPYLNDLDMVLVMSVEPGRGGQTFIEDSTTKIEHLYSIRESNNYKFNIEVDGGINNETIRKCSKADICVVGSYITCNNYEESISALRKN